MRSTPITKSFHHHHHSGAWFQFTSEIIQVMGNGIEINFKYRVMRFFLHGVRKFFQNENHAHPLTKTAE